MQPAHVWLWLRPDTPKEYAGTLVALFTGLPLGLLFGNLPSGIGTFQKSNGLLRH